MQDYLNVASALWPFVSAMGAALAAWAAWSMRQLVGKALDNLRTELLGKIESEDQQLKVEFAGRIEKHDAQLLQHELKLSNLPSEEEFTKLTHEVSEMNGDMKAMKATLDSIQRDAAKSGHQITRIEDFLLKGSRV